MSMRWGTEVDMSGSFCAGHFVVSLRRKRPLEKKCSTNIGRRNLGHCETHEVRIKRVDQGKENRTGNTCPE